MKVATYAVAALASLATAWVLLHHIVVQPKSILVTGFTVSPYAVLALATRRSRGSFTDLWILALAIAFSSFGPILTYVDLSPPADPRSGQGVRTAMLVAMIQWCTLLAASIPLLLLHRREARAAEREKRDAPTRGLAHSP